MELVDGVTATDCLKRSLIVDGALGLAESDALDICIAVARGLAAAHAGGIVHRDVKPDNILIPFDESRKTLDYSAAKLADLGIAREERGAMSITETNASLGTAGYMAPEQICDAKTAGKPADVFGLGATLYVLLCGRAPFTGNSAFDVFTETINRPHKPVQVWPRCLAHIGRDHRRLPGQAPGGSLLRPDGGALLEDLIYCRRLLDTRGPAVKPGASNVALPRDVDRNGRRQLLPHEYDSWGICPSMQGKKMSKPGRALIVCIQFHGDGWK